MALVYSRHSKIFLLQNIIGIRLKLSSPHCASQLRALNHVNNIKINEDYSVMMTEVGKVRG